MIILSIKPKTIYQSIILRIGLCAGDSGVVGCITMKEYQKLRFAYHICISINLHRYHINISICIDQSLFLQVLEVNQSQNEGIV